MKGDYNDDYQPSIPEISLDEFDTMTFGVDIRSVEFIPYPTPWFFSNDINLQEQRLLAIIRFKENRRRKTGCMLTNSQLSSIMNVSEKRIQNMISDLKTRGYINIVNDGYRFLYTIVEPKK